MKRRLRTLITLSTASLFAGTQIFWQSTPAQAQVNLGNAGCPAGTRESTGPTSNRIINGDFTTNAGQPGPITPGIAVPPALGFTTLLPYRGDATYPDDIGGGGLSIENGPVPGAPGVVNGRGVTADEAARVGLDPPTPIDTYLYSNPNQNVGGAPAFPPAPVIWQQTLNNLRPNTVYNFKALFFNLLVQGAPGVPPQIVLGVGPGPGGPFDQNPPLAVGEGQAVPGFPNVPNVRQFWIPVQFAFRTNPGQTTVTLQILDTAQNVVGDDFGVTAIGLRECIPILGVSKNAGTPSPNGDGTFTVPYTITVRNFSTVAATEYDLLNLQLSDNLAQTFAAAGGFRVQPGSLQSPTLTVNNTFTGVPVTTDLLQGTDILPAGASATVTFNVILTPGPEPDGFGAFLNTVTANATSRGGSNVTAQSNDGVNPDLDNNGVPDPASPTRVSLPRTGATLGNQRFRLVKRITGVTRNGAPLPGVNFGALIDDPSTSDDNAPGWAQFPPIGVLNISSTNPLQSGDEVTYTVYFLSDGDSPALATNICDPIPASTTFVAGSTEIQRPGSSVSAGGAFFPPLAPLPANNSCTNQTNTNGSAIFDAGDVSNTAGNNFGLVRFRVRIN